MIEDWKGLGARRERRLNQLTMADAGMPEWSTVERQDLTHVRRQLAMSTSGLGTAEAEIVRAKGGQAPLRRSRLRISYSCTIA